MSSNGNSTSSNGKSLISFGDSPARSISALGVVEQLRLSYEPGATSTAALICAATAVARLQGEIDELWRNSMRIENEALSQRLVEVSHALQRAARLLEQDRAIG
ncbi:MAG TPA: hypothetical protein VM282_09485 [Acidimicrobiales bacterium]|nr:hypothetical protein [Acidimicrobiales bacterium]